MPLSNEIIQRSIQQKRDLLGELLRTNFKLRYNDSVLGVIWVILKPLLNFVILFVVFSNFRSLAVEKYEVHLLLGIILYGYFSESVLTGTGSLRGMAHIILKINFPKEIAVMSSQGLALISMGINLLILIIFAIVKGVDITFISALYFLGIILIMTILTYGISLFTSIASVRFRDVTNLIEVFLQMGFYLSPIIYTTDILPTKVRTLIELNPMTVFIDSARKAVIFGDIANIKKLAIIFVITLVIVFINHRFFKKHMRNIAEYY